MQDLGTYWVEEGAEEIQGDPGRYCDIFPDPLNTNLHDSLFPEQRVLSEETRLREEMGKTVIHQSLWISLGWSLGLPCD